MSLTPLHFFFAFLFYTDVLSTLLVVASYLVSPARMSGSLLLATHPGNRCRPSSSAYRHSAA